MSPALETLIAAAPCIGCDGTGNDGELGFYQVAASVFVVLLLTGVVAEIRELRSPPQRAGGSVTPLPWKHAIAIAVVFSTLLFGELLSLTVLLQPPPSSFQQIAVSICLVIAVIGVPSLIVFPMLGERLTRLRHALLLMPILGLVGVGIYLAFLAITTPTRTYHVYGTCASGKCELNERGAPRIKSEKLGQLRDGDEVSIVCQTLGTEVPDPKGGSSVIWNRLDTGAYITDVYVDTPPIDSGLPPCSDRPEATSPRG